MTAPRLRTVLPCRMGLLREGCKSVSGRVAQRPWRLRLVPSSSVASVIDARRLALVAVRGDRCGRGSAARRAGADARHRKRCHLAHSVRSELGPHQRILARAAAPSGTVGPSVADATLLLVALSLFKYDVLQMTVSFVDLMIVDVDALMFLFALFPDLRWQAAVALLVGAVIATVFWRFDPFRLRRRQAALLGVLCLGGLTAVSLAFPQDPWEGFLRDNHVSKFARSGVTSVSEFLTHGFMESDAATAEALSAPLVPVRLYVGASKRPAAAHHSHPR